jgi:hypothetical protein
VVWLDAGDYFGDSSPAGLKNTQTLTEGMRRIGYAAVNLGEREVIFGLDRLQQEMKKASFPFLSANMVYQDSGEPFLQPTLILSVPRSGAGAPGAKKGKIRVGILGLARQNAGFSQKTPEGRRIVTSDPVEAARRAVPALKKKSDLVVALVTLELEEAKALAKEVPGIDVVLGGFGAVQTTEEIPAGPNTPPSRIVYAGNQGKKLGEIRVFLDPGKPPRLNPILVNLGRNVPDDAALMDLVTANRLAINEINRKEAPLVDVKKMMAMYEGAAYVQSGACKDCHAEEYRIWEESKHAHAFRILEEKHQDYNPECVGCHTTGFRRPTGYVNAKSTPDLMNVQCESCHGPGKGHPETVGKGYGAANLDTCRPCHTAENSPDFDPTAYMVKIRHWKTDPGAGAAAGGSRR